MDERSSDAVLPVLVDLDAAGMVAGGLDVDDDLALLALLGAPSHRVSVVRTFSHLHPPAPVCLYQTTLSHLSTAHRCSLDARRSA